MHFLQVLKSSMKKTRSKLGEWIQNCSPSVKDIVAKFPPLTLGLKTVSSLSCLTIMCSLCVFT